MQWARKSRKRFASWGPKSRRATAPKRHREEPMTIKPKTRTPIVQAIARHMAAQAALDAVSGAEDYPEHLCDEEAEALDELAFTPCAVRARQRDGISLRRKPAGERGSIAGTDADDSTDRLLSWLGRRTASGHYACTCY